MSTTIQTVAWTGGDRPAKPSRISALQAGVQKYLFSELVVVYRKHWKIEPTWGMLRILFQVARLRAHESYQPARKSSIFKDLVAMAYPIVRR